MGLGLAYYEPETISLLRAGRVQQALHLYFTRHARRSPCRYLHRRAGLTAQQRVLRTALALTLACQREPGRQLNLFLMHNDQRTHLHHRMETLPRMRYEVLTPFFDADLLRFVLACPVDDFAGHKPYHDLLSFVPELLNRIP